MIFAQAAGTPIVYVATTNPSPAALAIFKPASSKLQTIKDLVGKKVAVAKGSSAHYLLVSALAHAGVPYEAVDKAFLRLRLGKNSTAPAIRRLFPLQCF